MTSHVEKAQAFKGLHEANETFIIPNPWDMGSACLLQGMGFKALATTSSGFAESIGKVDGQVTLDEKLEHCRALSSVTDIPITADFENGFADAPRDAADNFLKLAKTGVAGGSIEDYSGSEIYDFGLAVERVAACAEAAATLSFPFSLTARAESLLRVGPDMDEIIKRLQAFEAAGADVLYAPGLRELDQVEAVMDAVSKPVNVLAPFMPDVTLAQYTALGVCRVSIGGALAKHSRGATLAAAGKMNAGNFNWG